MTAPGFYDDVPEADYHADRESLSVSGAKLILKAPALYRHRLDNPETKRTLDFGAAAHQLVLGVGPELVAVQREIRNRKGELLEVIDAPDYKSDSAQAHRDSIRAVGGIPLLAKELAVIRAMADALSSHTLAMRLLSNGKPEVSAYALDETTGVMRRCRFDYLAAGIATDYKTAASADPEAFVKAAANYGYHMQEAWYSDVAADLGQPLDAFVFIAQEKEPPHLVTVVELPAELVEVGRVRNRRALERFRDCTESGEWPGYIPDNQWARPTAPRWALYDNEIETGALA